MARQKYKFDSENLTFTVVQASLKYRILRLLLFFVLSLMLAFVYAKIYTTFFETPKVALLKNRSAELKLKYNLLYRDIQTATAAVNEITQRDRNVYRAIFGLRELSMPQTNIKQKNNEDTSAEFLQVTNALSDLRRKVYLQSKSFDEVGKCALNMKNMSASVPAIHPINLKKVRSYSEFGWRRHPVFGGMRFHDGLDFATDIGTPIYCTGDGVVSEIKYSFTGYGNVIDIDHGFGYKTRYAHLSKIHVRKGMTVKRGDEIGAAGKSGTATGPHLHYEVHYMGQLLNPRKFFPSTQSDINYNEVFNNR